MLDHTAAPRNALCAVLLAAAVGGCGEPMFENAGSQQSLLEDREACAAEINQSPAARAYRENPAARPEYATQVFEEMNHCIERKGWKQVRSPQELEQVRHAIASEATRTAPPAAVSDSKAGEALVRSVEDRLARASSTRQSAVTKD
jgi:hypothetical protein